MACTGMMQKSLSEFIRILVSTLLISLSLSLFSSLREGGNKNPPPEVSPPWKTVPVAKSKSSSALLQDVKASVKGSSHMSLGVYSMIMCVYSRHSSHSHHVGEFSCSLP